MLVLEEALKDCFIEPIIMTAFPSIGTASKAVARGVFRYLIKGDNSKRQSSILEAVRLAVEHNENLQALDRAIVQLEKVSTASDYDKCAECDLCVELAKQSFSDIMKLRGRKTVYG